MLRSRRLASMHAVGLLMVAACSDLGVEESLAPPIPHDVEFKEECLMCHSGLLPNVAGVPADHEGYGNETCLDCHAVGRR
jgi:hypothetical protein